ncbi:MAG: hypothetical protein JJT94_01840 [Bernardetiaceae bacterium]|nr:hypothetical protein [Bernardetiaceae bacterium]
MKQIFILWVALASYACSPQSKQNNLSSERLSTDSIVLSNDSAISERAEESPVDAWQQYQDSLRDKILQSKENESLKNSFLQEHYIRNVVTISNDSLYCHIPFNVHEPDCGTSDCYSNDLSFVFLFLDTLIFPKNLPFREHQHGCIDREQLLEGNLNLIEQTDKHVIYHSPEHKRTLVLFSSKEYTQTTAFYFTGVEKNEINGTNIYTISDVADESFKEKKYPYTSFNLNTNEYELFVQKRT